MKEKRDTYDNEKSAEHLHNMLLELVVERGLMDSFTCPAESFLQVPPPLFFGEQTCLDSLLILGAYRVHGGKTSGPKVE